MLSQTGGTCVCDLTDRLDCNNVDSYVDCKEGTSVDSSSSVDTLPCLIKRFSLTITPEVRRDLITATAAVAGFSSFAFGFLTNLPVALAQVFLVPETLCQPGHNQVGPAVLTSL